jgi:hypothetical protein
MRNYELNGTGPKYDKMVDSSTVGDWPPGSSKRRILTDLLNN